jgi:hypothetical protein
MDLLCKLLIDKYLAMTRWFIPPELQSSEQVLKNAQNVVTLALMAAVAVPFFASLYRFLEFEKAGVIVLLGGVGMLSSPFVLKVTGRLMLARETFICSFYAMKLWLAYYLGGIESPTLPWLLLCPMIALVVGGMRPGAVWGAIITLSVSGVFFVQTKVMPFPPVTVNDQRLLQVVSVLGLFVFSAVLLLFFKPRTLPSHGTVLAKRK